MEWWLHKLYKRSAFETIDGFISTGKCFRHRPVSGGGVVSLAVKKKLVKKKFIVIPGITP
ncbi:hypothetical protein BTA51_27775 [Hahella sp. CCB-MM4]|nr:hypothetical protein BTA51_27775 [Hahella sp. CCB-MM4]